MENTIRFAQRFLWGALITAWLGDMLFWGKAPGISFPLWIAVIIITIFLLAWSEGVKPAGASWILATLAIIPALLTIMNSEGLTRFVNGGLALGSVALLAASFTHGYWTTFRPTDYLIALLNLAFAAISRPVSLFRDAFKPEDGSINDNPLKTFSKRLVPLLRGLLLAAPVILILATLLASADPIFKDTIERYIQFIDLKRLPEYLFRLFYIIFILTYLFAGFFVHAIHPSRPAQKPDWNKNFFKPFLGITEGNVILISINILFAIFVFIQFQYFFGGQTNINISGFTYSEYARRGFGELVVVAILSLMIYLSLSTMTRQVSAGEKASFTLFSVLLMSEVLIILISAFQRLLLYESAYGFTQLRTYPHIFIIWLGILLLATIVFEVIRRRQMFTLALLLSIFGFGFTLAGISVDAFILRQNVFRASQGYSLDTYYLQNLSSEAVPDMVNFFLDEKQPRAVHKALGVQLACRYALMAHKQIQPWQSYQVVEDNANKWLANYAQYWSDYQAEIKDGEGWVVKINNETVPCRQYRDFMD